MNSKIILRNQKGEDSLICQKGKRTILRIKDSEIEIGENILCFDAAITSGDAIYIMFTDGLNVNFAIYDKKMEIKVMDYPFGGNNFKIIMAGSIPIVFFTAVEKGRTGIYMHFIGSEQKPRLVDKCMGGKLPFSAALNAEGDIDIVYTDNNGCLSKYRYKWSIKDFIGKTELLPADTRYFSPKALFYGGLHIALAVKENELSSIVYINPDGKVEKIYKGAPLRPKLILYRIKEDIFVSWDQHGVILSLNLSTRKLSEGEKSYRINEYIRVRKDEESKEKNIPALFGVFERDKVVAPIIGDIFYKKDIVINKREVLEGEEVMKMAGVMPAAHSKTEIDLKKLKIKIDMLEKRIMEMEKNNIPKAEG